MWEQEVTFEIITARDWNSTSTCSLSVDLGTSLLAPTLMHHQTEDPDLNTYDFRRENNIKTIVHDDKVAQ